MGLFPALSGTDISFTPMVLKHFNPPKLREDVQVKRHPRARRLILRVATKGDGVELVAPKRASQREIARFVALNNEWIEQHLAARPPRIVFADGAEVPLEGVPHRIVRATTTRGIARREEGALIFPCLAEHLPRRVTDYMIREARRAIMEAVNRHGKTILVKPSKVTLRDTTTRWGSCSSSGALSFSWRLILAPPDILDYVVAHEVAHLRHMDHGPKFWALCRKLAPQTDRAKQWLSDHGPTLHRYG